jgi:hypothetical protein
VIEITGGREALAEDLRDYGEDELASRALKLSNADFRRIQVLAGELLLDERYATPSGASMVIAKACALAAVTVMEGERRELKRKRRRAGSRRSEPSSPARLSAEKPRDVYRAACAELGKRFEERGFAYRRSQECLTRASGEFGYSAHFGTSYWNRTGEYVGLQLYALNVRSQALAGWRVAHGSGDRDWVAGGLPLNLGVGGPADHWNLADPSGREQILDLAERKVVKALRWFEQFDDPEGLVRALSRRQVLGFGALDAVEWLLSRGEPEAALAHGRLVLREQRARAQYESALVGSELTNAQLHDPFGLAWAARAYDLSF